jgi:4-hydroxy-3-polyprenylbenzoate decarboxylase
MTLRLVVGITGATGAVYGVRLLERARALGVETHVVVTPSGVLNTHHELGLDRKALEAKADFAYAPGDVGACLASGSFGTAAMVVAPCSMKTLASVAHGFSDNLLTRAADVTLKERRKLLLMVRETPFNLAHLRNMTAATEMDGPLSPPPPCVQGLRSGRAARHPAAPGGQHGIGVRGTAPAAVVAAQGEEQVSALDVQVMAQDGAAKAQIGLHVDQPANVTVANQA